MVEMEDGETETGSLPHPGAETKVYILFITIALGKRLLVALGYPAIKLNSPVFARYNLPAAFKTGKNSIVYRRFVSSKYL